MMKRLTVTFPGYLVNISKFSI